MVSRAARVRSILLSTAFLVCWVLSQAAPINAANSGEDADLIAIQRQVQLLSAAEARERGQMQSDEKLIKTLEQRLEKLDARNRQIEQTSQQLKSSKDADRGELQRLEHQVESVNSRAAETAAAPTLSGAQFDSFVSRYLGSHQFVVAGDAAGGFIYDRQTATNTFNLQFQPIILYRLNDWILFEGSIAASLPNGADASFSLPVATAQVFLNDYLELVAGIYDQPFGDFYEDQSPLWVNRFVTAPLPYGAMALIPPTDIGIQLRGSIQWGALGQDADYTLWAGNGPTYDTSLPQPAVGQTLEPETNIGLQSNGRAYGARFRFYPLPLDTKLGRLEVGASTYDGKWSNSLWLNSWGVDFAYLRKNFQARGEFLEAYRQMPSGGPDNRQGWTLQAGYFLQGLPDLGLGDSLNLAVRRLEPLIRYSGVNQREVVTNEIQNTPALGFNGSPSIFSPHAREVALGLDYWIQPSIVWQTEFDLELPGAGGTLSTFNGSTLTSRPAKTTVNDQALLTQLSIGF